MGRKLLWLMLFTSTCLYSWPERPDRDQYYFVTLGRCGTTWLIYCIQQLTQIPIHGPKKLLRRSYTSLDVEREPIYFSHDPMMCETVNMSNNYLITIVRDYREIICRYKNLGNEVTPNYYDYYLNYLKLYERWDAKKRILIRYEDLITQPRQVLVDLLLFLKQDTDRLDVFMDNFEFHRQKSLKQYDNRSKSYSRGNDVRFHSRSVPIRAIKHFDKTMQKTAGPVIWKKYLKQYCTELNKE